MTGLTPVYCSNAAFTTPIISSISGAYSGNINTTAGSFDNPYVNWSANGYRLPTEGEYQYAASYINGSSWTPYNYASGATAAYTDEAATDLVGWDGTNSGGATHVVGGLAANALGIYDMSGNVLEWCFDGYGTYPTTAQSNYTGPASGSARILRGGYYNYTADYLQVGLRIAYGPYMVNAIFGFRFARTD
jgi:formylglycine-generating enzyme required for sulfatase activity